MFADSVIIARDRSGADVRAFADIGVPDERQVPDLGTRADLGRFHFDIIPYGSAFADFSARAKPRERPDRAARSDFAFLEMGKCFDP